MRTQKAPEIDPDFFGGINLATPEQKLWAVVLIRAYDDFVRGVRFVEQYQNRKKWTIAVEQRFVENYFYSNAYYIGSFKWICEALFEKPDSAANAIREKIKYVDMSRKKAA
jgi:hypothetical protein